MKQILKGEKLAFDAEKVKRITVPNFPELSLKNLYLNTGLDMTLHKYLPSKNKRFVDREFVWNVAFTVRPEQIKKIIRAAITRRKYAQKEDEKK